MSLDNKNQNNKKNQKKFGQYFTKDTTLKEKLYSFILNKPKLILEPSVGRGDLVEYVQKKLLENDPDNHTIFNMYEIDNTINFLDTIDKSKIHFTDFTTEIITKKYPTIIGNPPYVKQRSGNLYITFTDKCYRLLSPDGELIFIVPSDFFKLTKSAKLLNEMMLNGSFTHIYHPHNENLFEDASIDVLIYRYCKNPSLDKKTIYNEKEMHIVNNNGLITFTETLIPESSKLISDYFNVYVGIVNGKEEVYKNETLGNIEVLNGENKKEKYIYLDKFPTPNEELNKYMLDNKDVLISRKIKKFNNDNWYEWGAPRNISVMKKDIGKDCIYIYNLTRKATVAFKGKVGYFGGSLIMLLPKNDIGLLDLDKAIEYLNSEEFKKKYTFSNRFKIGHRQLCNSNIINIERPHTS